MNPDSLSDLELLALLMGEKAAAKIYQQSLASLFVTGAVDREIHPKIAAARELVKRVMREEMKRAAAFSTPSTVCDFIRLFLLGKEYEVFMVLFLDSQTRLIEAEELFRGTLSQTSVYPREIVKRALRLNAAMVILAHNHPAGAAVPSRSDEALTQTLKAALSLVDIRVLDHFIVAGSESMSFAEKGLL